MADLKTKYMSLDLANPVVVGACSLSKTINQIKEIEEAGAGALVIKSLFEEQIQAERAEMDDKLTQYDDLHPEALSLFPSFEHGPQQHLFWVRKAREAVSLPLIASLNAVTDEVWVDYARQLAETGVDGLELNFYSPALDPRMTARDMERRELDVFARVREAVKIPLSVKLHPFYTNVFNHATQLVIEGYPRSANTYAVVAFAAVQPERPRIAHHLHVAAQVLAAVDRDIPTMVLIRRPQAKGDA